MRKLCVECKHPVSLKVSKIRCWKKVWTLNSSDIFTLVQIWFTSNVVRNRSESIRGKRDSEGGKHTDGGNTNTIHASKFFAGQNGDDEDDNRNDGWKHTSKTNSACLLRQKYLSQKCHKNSKLSTSGDKAENITLYGVEYPLPQKKAFLGGGGKGIYYIFSSIFVQSQWFKM